ncbi:MAG: DNA polymerase III subunit alpha, partial [Betaproteobacteria bacterium]|nr:DNA polymerase III subunit alpha [Betaproteobacteria bacterium]
LDITDMDPVAHGLIFERFLNPERVSLPDFDIDFCVEGRDRVIAYAAEKYGAGRVAQIVTFGQIGARSAVRDAGRVLGYPYSVSDRIARLIPGAPDITLEKSLAESEQLRREAESGEVRELLKLSREVEGLPRNIGTHAGGVLIAPQPIVNFCPLYAAADTNSMVSQMDMDDIEKIGLVKFDFLGLKTLTILARAEAMLKSTGAVAVDFSLDNIPMDDKESYQIYGSGELKGVFQCESRGMGEMMRRVNPDRFGDIVALIALYRPGPMQFMDAFIDGKHGRREITYPHPDLEECLEETYGIWVYQEQVMETARKIAGYSLGEADLLRRAMGKKKPEEMKKQKQRFVDGAAKKMAKDKSDKLFEQIAKFAEYGFNKAHAAAYALISYRTAYLKAHYPAALYAAAMSVSGGDKDLKEFADCARAAKIRLSPPDINTGRRDFYLSEDGGIVYGLKAIKG